MNKIKIFKILCFFIITSVLHGEKVSASNFQYTIEGTEKIKISKANFSRLLEYEKGEFYSKVYGTKIKQVFGLYFALSEKGNTVSFSFCEDDMIGCNTNLLKYQTKATCEKFAKEACNIIAINKNLVLNKKIIPIENEKKIQKYFIIDTDQKISSFSYEIRAQNLRDFGNDDYR
jgi:hypothetical protein